MFNTLYVQESVNNAQHCNSDENKGKKALTKCNVTFFPFKKLIAIAFSVEGDTDRRSLKTMSFCGKPVLNIGGIISDASRRGRRRGQTHN